MRTIVLIALSMLCACRDQQPQAPTARQSDQLNEAEDMLNGLSQNEEGPEANASDPSINQQ